MDSLLPGLAYVLLTHGVELCRVSLGKLAKIGGEGRSNNERRNFMVSCELKVCL